MITDDQTHKSKQDYFARLHQEKFTDAKMFRQQFERITQDEFFSLLFLTMQEIVEGNKKIVAAIELIAANQKDSVI